MKKTAFLTVALWILAASGAQAAPVCATLDECLTLQMQVAAKIRELSPLPSTRTTISGHTFKQVADRPELGNAWKDESGVIWGDMIVDQDGKALELSQQGAAAYCNKIGGHLPTQAQYLKLTEYLGAKSVDGYNPEVLPNLIENIFWTSSVLPESTLSARIILGSTGRFGNFPRDNGLPFRCVIR